MLLRFVVPAALRAIATAVRPAAATAGVMAVQRIRERSRRPYDDQPQHDPGNRIHCTHLFSPHINPSARSSSATAKLATQATAHWVSTSITAQFRPSSRLTAATAATQGVYSSEKIKNTSAVP